MSDAAVIEVPGKKVRKSHVWEKAEFDHYIEPPWCSARLFEAEDFIGTIYDPACGIGTIFRTARAAGLDICASDLQGWDDGHSLPRDFFAQKYDIPNIVSNPPFTVFKEFALKALDDASRKVALMWLSRRVLAAGKWLRQMPLARIYYLTPRPSMPPAHLIKAGIKPAGGSQDYVWLVWDKKHVGRPEVLWLHRDHGVL